MYSYKLASFKRLQVTNKRRNRKYNKMHSTSYSFFKRRPVDVTTPELIEKIHKFVVEYRRLKLFEQSETVKIKKNMVNILHNLL